MATRPEDLHSLCLDYKLQNVKHSPGHSNHRRYHSSRELSSTVPILSQHKSCPWCLHMCHPCSLAEKSMPAPKLAKISNMLRLVLGAWSFLIGSRTRGCHVVLSGGRFWTLIIVAVEYNINRLKRNKQTVMKSSAILVSSITGPRPPHKVFLQMLFKTIQPTFCSILAPSTFCTVLLHIDRYHLNTSEFAYR